MELTQEQLENVGKQFYKGKLLEKILSSQFPDATITIIKGIDYMRAAYFNEERAKDKINPNETIMLGTVRDLEQGNLDVNKLEVYDSLKKRFRKILNRPGSPLEQQYYGDN